MLEGLKFEEILAVLETRIRSKNFEDVGFEDVLLSLISPEDPGNTVSADKGELSEDRDLSIQYLLRFIGNSPLPTQFTEIDEKELKDAREISRSETDPRVTNLDLNGRDATLMRTFLQAHNERKPVMRADEEGLKETPETLRGEINTDPADPDLIGKSMPSMMTSVQREAKGGSDEIKFMKISNGSQVLGHGGRGDKSSKLDSFKFITTSQGEENIDTKGVPSKWAGQDRSLEMPLVIELKENKEFKKEIANGDFHNGKKIEKPNENLYVKHSEVAPTKGKAEIYEDPKKFIGSLPSENGQKSDLLPSLPDKSKDASLKREMTKGAGEHPSEIGLDRDTSGVSFKRDTYLAGTGLQERGETEIFSDRQAPLSKGTQVARGQDSKNGNSERYQLWSPNVPEELKNLQNESGEPEFVKEVQRREVLEHQVRSEVKQLSIRVEGANLRFRFQNTIFSVDIRVQESLERGLSYLDVQRLSRSIQSLGLNLEALRVNGVDLLSKNSKVGRREERINIREDAGSGKEANSSLSDSSDLSLFL